MKKADYIYLIEEMKRLNITLQDFEKCWKEFEEDEKEKELFINSELVRIKKEAISRFLGKVIFTGKSSYLLVKDIDIRLHYSSGYLVDFIGPKLDINILEDNIISIHTWNNIQYKSNKNGGMYSIYFSNDSNINWDRITTVERDVFDSVIDHLQDKVSLFIGSLKDYFYEVKA